MVSLIKYQCLIHTRWDELKKFSYLILNRNSVFFSLRKFIISLWLNIIYLFLTSVNYVYFLCTNNTAEEPIKIENLLNK